MRQSYLPRTGSATAQMKSILTQPMPAARVLSSWAASSSPWGAWRLTPNGEEAPHAAGERRRIRRTKRFSLYRMDSTHFALSIIYTSRVGNENHGVRPIRLEDRGMQFRELTDRYQLQKILKSTRFGTVLRATDIPSGRTVAVKLVTAGQGLAAGAAEFGRLAAALADLGHPNLPAVFDSGFTSDGSAFLVLELLEGRSFDTLAGSPPARLLSLVSQAL